MDTQRNPYIGPRTFQRAEGHLFFGREREARDLISLVASERLVVFYAQSGAGKSSIVNTRLIPNLEAKQYEVLPVGRVSGDSGEGLKVSNIYVYNLLRSLDQHDDPAPLATLTLEQFLCQLNYDDKGFFYDPALPDSISTGEEATVIRRALIIDQFEELFSTHPEAWEKREDFFLQVARAMQDDPHLWVVLVMREDYIAALDPYAHLVSNGLRVRYYMQRLGREAALKAVKSPVEGIRPYADGVAEKLIDDLCSIKVQQPDGTLDVQPGQYVEPVQMQVVCYGLWENLSPDGTQITEQDLQDVGDVNQSLGKYYDRRVAEVARAKHVRERLIREWFEKKLITAGGIRNMVLQERESKPGELSDDVIQALQSDLVRGEKRGGATWYELTHDRLVEPILERNKVWFSENLSPLQRQAALWKDQEENETWLLRDQALAEVQEWAEDHKDELNETEKEFLAACQKLQAQIDERHAAERQQLEMANKLASEEARSAKRARIFNVVFGILVIIATIAIFYAFGQKAEADAKRAEAETASNIAHSGELSIAALERAQSQLDLALLLGIQADKFNTNTQTQKAMLVLMQKSSRYLKTIPMQEKIDQVQFSPDGSTLASFDKTGVTFWDATSYERLNDEPINEHFSGVSALAVTKDGAVMASAAVDGTIAIWSTNATVQVPLGQPFKAHTDRITSLAFSPDGKTLASASWDSSIILWDVSDQEKLSKPVQIGNPLTFESLGVIYSLAFSPDGKLLASGMGDRSIVLWNVETRKPVSDDANEQFRGHEGPIFGLAFSADGKILASGSYDDNVILWDISDPEQPEQKGEPLTGHTTDIEMIALSPDGKTLASGDDAGDIILWNIRTGERVTDEPLNGNTEWVISLAFSPDGNTLAAGSLDNKVILWDVKKETQIGQTILEHRGSVRGVAFIANGQTLITASEDSRIQFWNVSRMNSPQKMGEALKGHPGRPTGITFSTDGSLLESHGDDGTILLDVRTQKPVGIGSILRSPDENFLVYEGLDSATDQITIHLIDSNGKPLGHPILGQNPSFSPDSRILIYETRDPDTQQALINLWDIAMGKNISPEIAGFYPFFSPSNRILVYQTSNPDTEQSYIYLWGIDQARNMAEEIAGSYLAMSKDEKLLFYQTTDPDTSQSMINLWDVESAENIGEAFAGSYLGLNLMSQTLVYQTFDDATGESGIVLRDTLNATEINITGSNEYSISPDGTVLAFREPDAETGDMILHVVDTATGEPIIEPVVGSFSSWSQNSNILLCSTYDNENGRSIKALNTRTGDFISAFSNSDLEQIYEASGQLVYQIYDFGQGKHNLVLINTATSSVQGPFLGTWIELTADGKYLIYGPGDGSGSKVSVWDVSRYTQIAALLEGNLIELNKDSEILAYQSADGAIRLFDVVKRKHIGEPFQGTFLGMSPDGHTLATLNENNAIVFWDTMKTWPLGEPLAESAGKVESAALSSDGKLLAFADEQGLRLMLQDVSSSKITSLKNEHYGTVTSMRLSADKNILLSFGEDDKAILWEVDTGLQLSTPIPVTTNNSSGYFSPKENFAVIIDYIENTTVVWDLRNQKVSGEPFAGQIVTFSPNETYVAISDSVENSTRVWNLSTQEYFMEAVAGQSVAFSPDEKFMTIADSSKNTITLWDLSARDVIGTPPAGGYAAFSPKGNLLAVIDPINDSVTLWNIASQAVIGESLPGEGVVFASDGQTLAVSAIIYSPTYAVTTVLIDLANSQPIGEPFQGSVVSTPETNDIVAIIDRAENHTFFWDSTAKQSSGQSIAGMDSSFFGSKTKILMVRDSKSNTTTFWNPVTHSQIGNTLAGIYDPSISPDGTLISMADLKENSTILWDLKMDQQVGEAIPGYFSPSICADNKTVAWFDSANTSVYAWNLEQHQSLGELQFDPSNIYNGVGLFFNARCDRLAIADYSQNTTTLWDLTKKQAVNEDPIDGTNILFSLDGSRMAIGNYNSNHTTFWNATNATQLGEEEVLGASIYTNPENSNIISIERYIENIGYRYSLWDLRSLTQIDEESTNYYPSFSSDGQLIVAGDKGITVWAVDGTRPEAKDELHGHSASIKSMLFSKNGYTLASLASDGIILTDLDTGSAVHLENGDFTGQLTASMAFGADDNSVTALGRDGTILKWEESATGSISTEPRIINSPYTSAYRSTLSPDGKYLIYENTKNNLFVWDIEKGDSVGDHPLVIQTCCEGGAVAFTPDSNIMFLNDGGKIYRWDAWNTSTDPQTEFSFGQNTFFNIHVVMDPNELASPKYLIASYKEKENLYTQIWDWAKNSRVGDPIPGTIQVFGSNMETKVLIYKDDSGRLIRFDLNPAAWRDLLCERSDRNLNRTEWDQYIGENVREYQKVCAQYALEP